MKNFNFMIQPGMRKLFCHQITLLPILGNKVRKMKTVLFTERLIIFVQRLIYVTYFVEKRKSVPSTLYAVVLQTETEY